MAIENVLLLYRHHASAAHVRTVLRACHNTRSARAICAWCGACGAGCVYLLATLVRCSGKRCRSSATSDKSLSHMASFGPTTCRVAKKYPVHIRRVDENLFACFGLDVDTLPKNIVLHMHLGQNLHDVTLPSICFWACS